MKIKIKKYLFLFFLTLFSVNNLPLFAVRVIKPRKRKPAAAAPAPEEAQKIAKLENKIRTLQLANSKLKRALKTSAKPAATLGRTAEISTKNEELQARNLRLRMQLQEAGGTSIALKKAHKIADKVAPLLQKVITENNEIEKENRDLEDEVRTLKAKLRNK